MSQETLHRLRFGVNYVPSSNWYYMWNQFNLDCISKDFEAIAQIGADHIRLMMIWPYFQPNPTWVSSDHLRCLRLTIQEAEKHGLDVFPVFFTGWLSGYGFNPPFLDGVRDVSFYNSSSLRDVQLRYIDAVIAEIGDLHNVAGFDLGNEMNCQWKAPTANEGNDWMDWALAALRAKHSGVHVNGVDHQPWFYENTFSATHLAECHEILTLHSWIKFTGAMDRAAAKSEKVGSGPTTTKLLANMARLARSYAQNSQKPVWIQEFGATDEWMPESQIPRFLQESVVEGIAEGVSWFTWWCSHDIDRSMKFDELEYGLGLLTVDNKRKPVAEAFKELAQQYRGKSVSLPVRGPEPPPQNYTFESTWAWLDQRTL